MNSQLSKQLAGLIGSFVQVETNTLQAGDALNWAVHQANGIDLHPTLRNGRMELMRVQEGESPAVWGSMQMYSESWRDGGDLIDSMLLTGDWIVLGGDGRIDLLARQAGTICHGTSLLEAACKAKVTQVLGKVINIPAVFMP